jgi:DNA-directed RNA polymerase I, II, and III subunit RPABC2
MSDNEFYTDESDNEDIDTSDDEKTTGIQKLGIQKSGIPTIDDILSESESDEEDEEEEKIVGKDDDDYYDEEQDGGGIDDDESEDDDEDEEPDEESLSVPKQKKAAKMSIDPILDDNDDDDMNDDEDDEDENYLQKFDNEISRNYISEQHPECAHHNYDEIAKLSVIVRDNDSIIIDNLHKTLPFLTKYERTRVLGQRASQIENGAKPFIKIPEGIIDAHIIAELELQQKKIPFIIRRPIPGGASEYWNLKDLEMILF